MFRSHLLLGVLICCGIAPVSWSAEICKQYAEIVFLVDTSSDIAVLDYPLELKFVKGVIAQFDVSWSTTRVAAIDYSDGAKLKFGLDHFTNVEQVHRGVDHITFTRGSSRESDAAIRLARELLSSHSRDGAARVIVYLTVGKPTDQATASEEAEKARKENILLFTVGVGADVDKEELGQLANKDNAKFVHTAGDFNELLSLDVPLSRQICSGDIVTVIETTTVETTTQSTTMEPTTTAEPTTVEPATTAEPTTMEPATTAEPTTMEPTTTMETTTAEPTAMETTTAEPTTMKPSTAKPTKPSICNC